MEHELKTWPEFFNQTRFGEKLFEYRKNDRDFHSDDVLRLREYLPSEKCYTGREIMMLILKVQKDIPGLPKNYCIMSIAPFYEDKINV